MSILVANDAERLTMNGFAWQAFVKCQNFYGIQFVKGLHILKDKRLQRAEAGSQHFKSNLLLICVC